MTQTFAIEKLHAQNLYKNAISMTKQNKIKLFSFFKIDIFCFVLVTCSKIM